LELVFSVGWSASSDIRHPGVFFFFFSSRRRHTRFSRDWSSDVCSSDLQVEPAMFAAGFDTGTYITHAATPIDTNLARPQTITHGADTAQWDWTYIPGTQSSTAQIVFSWGTAAAGTYSYPSPACLNANFSG